MLKLILNLNFGLKYDTLVYEGLFTGKNSDIASQKKDSYIFHVTVFLSKPLRHSSHR